MMSFYPASSAFSEEIIALVSVKHPYYDEAMKGVESVCGCTVKPYYVEGFNLLKTLAEVRRQFPRVLLAVGSQGLKAAREFKDIPIVYSSATKPNEILSGEKNIIGVSMDVPIDQQLIRFIEFAPKVRRIGFIYDPRNNGAEAEVAKATAKTLGVELVIREVERYGQVPDAINEIRKKIDAFWVLPDITSSYEVALEYLIDIAIQEWIPVLIFSEKYLKMGATVSLNIDQFRLGIDAGLMVKAVLAGTKPQDVPPPGPRRMVVNINTITARKLGLLPDEPIIKLVSLIK
jgi:putative ABC transport system substrate-binding protein